MFGSVKWYNEKKGFGFIIPEDESKDIFVHVRNVVSSGILKEADRVEFEVVDTEKGPAAHYVKKIK